MWSLKYKEYMKFYTDGSKDPVTGSSGAAVVVTNYRGEMCWWTSDCLSVYTVEMSAI